LWETLSIASDPVGAVASKPIMPCSGGRMELWLGGLGLAKSVQFNTGLTEWPAIREQIRQTYKAVRATSLSVESEAHLRWLSVLQAKYGVPYTEFLSADCLDDVPRTPATSYTDAFTYSDGDLPTVSSGAWAELVNGADTADVNVSGNKVRSGSSETNSSVAQYTSALSTDDHYAEVDVDTLNTPYHNRSYGSSNVRLEDGGTNQLNTYYYQITKDSAAAVKGRLSKIVLGVGTNLQDNAQSWTTGDTIKTSADGSTVKGYINGVEKESVTDAAVAGVLYCGLAMRTSDGSAGDVELDNWAAADLAAGGATHTLTLSESLAVTDAATHDVLISRAVTDTLGLSDAVTSETLSTWGFRKAITVQDTNVSGNLTDFPLCVKLAADEDIGDEALATGYDIRFTAADGTTILDYERESWAGGAGTDATAVFWVRVPLIEATGGATLYLYYGKAGASDVSTRTAPWDANFEAVLHMGEAEGPYIDSVGTITDAGTGTDPAPVAGIAGIGQDFDLTNTEYVNYGDSLDFDNTDAFTVEWWVNRDVEDITQFVVTKQLSATTYRGWSTLIDSNNHPLFNLRSDQDTLDYIQTYGVAAVMAAGGWYHCAFTYDGSGDASGVKIYMNGSLCNMTTTVNNLTATTVSAAPLCLGARNAVAAYDGQMDEVRISSSVRAVEWIHFTFHNLAEADGELTWGGETPASGIATHLLSLSDTLGMSDVATRDALVLRAISDSLGLSDAVLREAVFRRAIADDLSMTDAVSRLATLYRVLSDTLGLADAVTRLVTANRAISDTMALSDAVSRNAAVMRAVAETLGLSDTALRDALVMRAISDELGLSDVLRTNYMGETHLLTLLETLGLSDLATMFPHAPYRTTASGVYTPGSAAAQVKGLIR
jgi:hypothetical protein